MEEIFLKNMEKGIPRKGSKTFGPPWRQLTTMILILLTGVCLSCSTSQKDLKAPSIPKNEVEGIACEIRRNGLCVFTDGHKGSLFRKEKPALQLPPEDLPGWWCQPAPVFKQLIEMAY